MPTVCIILLCVNYLLVHAVMLFLCVIAYIECITFSIFLIWIMLIIIYREVSKSIDVFVKNLLPVLGLRLDLGATQILK